MSNIELEFKEINNTIDFSYNDTYKDNTSELFDISHDLMKEDIDYKIKSNMEIYANYNRQQLIQICDFYNLTRTFGLRNKKKEALINIIILFEMDDDNQEIVNKRLTYWFFINELKKDPVMRQYIIW